MDIFKFNFDTDPTVLGQGELINGLSSKMWVERYSEPGEFEFTSPMSADIRSLLPEGTMISHVDTLEVMIVENHEIEEDGESDPILKTTGRSLVSYLEERMIGAGWARSSSIIGDVGMAEVLQTLPVQIATLINICLHPSDTGAEDDDLGNIVATYAYDDGDETIRTYKIGPLWPVVEEMLAIEDLGLRSIRRNTFGVLGSDTETQIEVYAGTDRSDTVIFSWRVGDLDQAQYLFSIKNWKNAAYVTSRYLNVVVEGVETGYDRRFMHVDASDLDDNLTAVPTGGTLTSLLAQMTLRGQQALRSQRRIVLTQADIPNLRQYKYRVDFNVGDIVRLSGNFGEITNMRITEFTEIEDENGESSHPTLSIPGV